MKPDLLTVLLFAASALTCMRLLFYRRRGARYRPHISAVAWLLIVSSGSTAIDILLGRLPPGAASIGHVGLAVVVCALTFAARGNVAAILRTDHDQHPARR